jgi:hypothetical protein
MGRKYSDAFVQRQIDKIYELKEKTDHEFFMLPEALDRPENQWMQKHIRDYVNHRASLAYIQGFWYGWTLRDGDPTQTDSSK